MSQSPPNRQERVRVSQACDNCRDKKSKCDGVKPVCGRCQQKSLNCRYGVSKRVKNQQIMKDLVNKVAQYESMLQKGVPNPSSLHDGGSGLDNQFVLPSLHFTSDLTPSTSGLPSIARTSVNADVHSTTTSSLPDVSSPRPSEMDFHSIPTFDSTPNTGAQTSPNTIQPPPRALLEEASRAFFQGTAILFSFFEEDEFDTLFDLVYESADSTESNIALTQLCAVAAVGCQYFPLTFDAATRTSFLSVAKHNLDDCIEETPLPAIRILALLTMYFSFEKTTAALLYADMGLRLATLYYNDPTFQESYTNSWQRVFRGLAFLDGWLCSKTGHVSSPQAREIQSSIVVMGASDSSLVSVIQHEMVKIAMLSNVVLRDICHTRYVSSSTISHYKNRLQNWLLALPGYMRLENLLDMTQQTEFFLRPILLIHLLYMSAIVLVYRRVLVDLASVDHKLSASDIFHQAQSFLEPCLWTGRQITKILGLCLSRGQILQRCWMFINITSSTCNVLLYFVASQLLHSGAPEEIEKDLAASKQCLDVLEFCSRADETVARCLGTFTSIYGDLAQIHNEQKSQSKSSVRSVDQSGNQTLQQLLLQTAEYLIHPFEAGFRKRIHQLQDQEAQSSTRPETPPSTVADTADTDMLTSKSARRDQERESLLFLNDFGRRFTGKEKDLWKGKESRQGSTPSSARSIVFGS